MMKQTVAIAFFYFLIIHTAFAQCNDTTLPVKIEHAEPLNMDLIRDLGARKGEKEINIGYKLFNTQHYTTQSGFIEYEFAPVNRLGLELEIPFRFISSGKIPNETATLPHQKIEGIKPAFQYTFLVHKKAQLSMAAGSIFELEMHSFTALHQHSQLWKGNHINPFLIVAKKWGHSFHTLLYTGPDFYHSYQGEKITSYQLNMSMHYMLPAQHFIGIEINREYFPGYTTTWLNPQAKLQISNAFALGIAACIPIMKTEGYGFITRLIYEL